jgi:hypothetical protein
MSLPKYATHLGKAYRIAARFSFAAPSAQGCYGSVKCKELSPVGRTAAGGWTPVSAHFTAHPASEHQAIFVLGMKKCGSSLFNTIVQRLCAANVPGYLSLPDHSFQ